MGNTQNALTYQLQIPSININSPVFLLEVYHNIQKTSINTRISILSQIVPLLATLNQSDAIIALNSYVYWAHSIETNLFILKDSVSKNVLGFLASINTEEYALDDDTSDRNKFIVTSAFILFDRNIRGKGLVKKFLTVLGIDKSERFGRYNCLHFNCSINPIMYYEQCKLSPMYPNRCYEMSEKLIGFLKKLTKKFDYKALDEKIPWVLKDDMNSDGINRDSFLNEYDNLPNDMKFFLDQTGMAEGTGLAGISLDNIFEDNTLELPEFTWKYQAPEDWVVKNIDLDAC